MRNRFDHLAKQIGKEALSPSGVTSAHDEISPETQHADLRHEPDPARKAERARLGLLGRIAAALCLIEIYGHAPSAEEFRACLAKHIAFWQKRARDARAQQKTAAAAAAPGSVRRPVALDHHGRLSEGHLDQARARARARLAGRRLLLRR